MIDASFDRALIPPQPEIDRDRSDGVVQSRLIVAMFLVYLAIGAMLSFFRGGTFLTPDRIGVLLLAGAIIIGQGRAFVRDWGPFLLLFFGYELMRGVADDMADLGAYQAGDHGRIQVQSLIDVDRWLFFGNLPTEWLQDRLYEPGVVHWYDTGAALIYLLHFILPLGFGFALWMRNRAVFRRFTVMLLSMSYLAFVFFLLVPAAPPWLAAEWGYMDNVDRPSQAAYKTFLPDRWQDYDTFKLWTKASPNPVAALPSLHAAFPWLVLLVAVSTFRSWGLLLVPYNLAVWFAVVYLSQHWFADVIAGVIWATAIWAVCTWLYGRRGVAKVRRREALDVGADGNLPDAGTRTGEQLAPAPSFLTSDT
jgi:membrane-associated phospholipid phosphatase